MSVYSANPSQQPWQLSCFSLGSKGTIVPGSGLLLHFSKREALEKIPVLGELCKLKMNGPVGALFYAAENELVNFTLFLLSMA